MSRLYFDHNATTPLSTQVQNALYEAMPLFANPSSHYQLGQATKNLIKSARESCASLLGTAAERIIFTSGGTESNNFAIQSILSSLPDGDLCQVHVISSSIEHPSILEALRFYQSKGLQLTLIDPDGTGRVDVNAIKAALKPETKLITLMAINNETGVIQPFEDVAHLAKSAGIDFHVDAVQAMGKLPIDLEKLPGITTLSFSGHKFNGPKGIGGLYCAPHVQIIPLLHGGGQESGWRSGTENTLGLAGLTAAVREAKEELPRRLKTYGDLRIGLLKCLDEHKVDYLINGNSVVNYQAPWTLNISFPNIRAESLASRLDLRHGIALSLGSACSNNKETRRSYTLLAMGLSNQTIDGAVRISFGHQTEKSEIEILAKAIKQEIDYLSALSGTEEKVA